MELWADLSGRWAIKESCPEHTRAWRAEGWIQIKYVSGFCDEVAGSSDLRKESGLQRGCKMISFTSLQSLLSQQSPNTKKINSVPDRSFKDVSSAMAVACKILLSAPPHGNEKAILGAQKPSAHGNLVPKHTVKMVGHLPMIICTTLSPLGFRLKERGVQNKPAPPRQILNAPKHHLCRWVSPISTGLV